MSNFLKKLAVLLQVIYTVVSLLSDLLCTADNQAPA